MHENYCVKLLQSRQYLTLLTIYSLISVSFVRNVFSKGKKAKFYNSLFKITTKLTIIRKFGFFSISPCNVEFKNNVEL